MINWAELDCQSMVVEWERFAEGGFINGMSGMLYAVCCMHRTIISCVSSTATHMRTVCCVVNHNEGHGNHRKPCYRSSKCPKIVRNKLNSNKRPRSFKNYQLFTSIRRLPTTVLSKKQSVAHLVWLKVEFRSCPYCAACLLSSLITQYAFLLPNPVPSDCNTGTPSEPDVHFMRKSGVRANRSVLPGLPE